MTYEKDILNFIYIELLCVYYVKILNFSLSSQNLNRWSYIKICEYLKRNK